MNYKIIKLNSGEELIADVVENEDSLILTRPMVFVNSTMSSNSGIAVDVTFLKDWLNNSDEKKLEIKKDKIIAIIDPSKKCSAVYDDEKKREDDTIKLEEEMEKNPEDLKEQLENMLDSFINDAQELPDDYYHHMDDAEEQYFAKKRKRRKKKKEPSVSSFIPKELQDRPMIYLNMIIPPEAIMNMITSGILEPEMLQKMIDEVKKKNKFTGDEKTREDFGNQFSDWNPDPTSDDY